jgi:hypothetical protein
MLKFLLGLPHVMRGPLIDAADPECAVLISANALSIRKKDASDIPVWHGFRTSNLKHLNGLEAYLDSAGFVAASRYRGFAWTVDPDHGALERMIGPTRGFQRMATAFATIKGFEVMRMIRHGHCGLVPRDGRNPPCEPAPRSCGLSDPFDWIRLPFSS